MKWDAAFSAIRTPHNLLRISIIPWHHFTFSGEPRPNRSVSIPGYRARIWGGGSCKISHEIDHGEIHSFGFTGTRWRQREEGSAGFGSRES